MDKSIENNDEFHIQASNISPEVIINTKDHKLSITGNSILNNSYSFYKNIYEKIRSFIQQNKLPELIVEIHLNFVNTQGIKEIINLLNYLEHVSIPVKIIWYYSDDDINDLGTQIGELIDLSFEKIYKEPSKFNFDKNL